MGSICTNQPIQLPDYKETVSGTQLPGFVAAGGKELYEQARELSKSPFPQFQGERIATFGTDAEGDPQRMTEREREGLDLLASGTAPFKTILDDATTMARTLGQGENLRFTPTDTDTLIGDAFVAPDFDTERAGQYQDVFQTSIDPAIEELNRQRQLQQRQNAADAIRAGAFGGSRLGVREALTDAEMARAGSDLRRQAGREALQFASQRFDTDRAFDAGRFDAERQARFAGEGERRAGFQTDLQGFETDEASRLRASETLSGLAPLAQGLQEQAASGMITAGQAERELDQRALDLAYSDFLAQQQFPFEMLNFALGALQGIPYETLTRQQATGNQFMQQPSIYGQTLGGLGSLASLYALSRR
tara:strand:+ start:523 stop:1611 length:1089 start_codon:yes stop_codon:yes gene_type:complete